MSELTVEQIEELAEHIAECMLEDRELLLDVAHDEAEGWSLKEYLEWKEQGKTKCDVCGFTIDVPSSGVFFCQCGNTLFRGEEN